MKTRLVIGCIALLLVSAGCFTYGRGIWFPVVAKFMTKKTVSDVIQTVGDDARQRLLPHFADAGIHYPPSRLALVAFKDSDQLHLWAANTDQAFVWVKAFPILAASGELGPKLREGDRQVPEGIYQITAFNPNSAYHLSMKLNYPNAFDLKYANAEGRDEPGSNIFIHGKAASIGCLAMGDTAIEALFTLVHDTGRGNTQVIISPSDPSIKPLNPPERAPAWTAQLYQNIEQAYGKVNHQYATKSDSSTLE